MRGVRRRVVKKEMRALACGPGLHVCGMVDVLECGHVMHSHDQHPDAAFRSCRECGGERVEVDRG